MRHKRHYSVEEANALRDWVAGELEKVRAAVGRLQRQGVTEALGRAGAEEGGGYPDREVAGDVVTLYLRLRQLQSIDVVVRDLGRGLVDFPALRDGEEVYLCWTTDEPSVAHWHELDAGAAGRQSL